MAEPGPVKIKNYGIEFKLRAVQLSSQPGVLVKDVADVDADPQQQAAPSLLM